MKELLLNSIVSKAREFTTFSMNTGSDFDPWNLKSADFLFIHSTLEITLIFFSETVCPNFYGWYQRGKNK